MFDNFVTSLNEAEKHQRTDETIEISDDDNDHGNGVTSDEQKFRVVAEIVLDDSDNEDICGVPLPTEYKKVIILLQIL